MKQYLHKQAFPIFELEARRRFQNLLILAATLSLPVAHAAGPEALLSYRSPDFIEAEEELRLEKEGLERTKLGLGASLEVEPYLTYSEDLSEPVEAPLLGPGVEGAASLGYTYNYPQILLSSIEVLQAEQRLKDAGREGVRAALMAYNDLLNAQLTVTTERAAFAEDQRDMAETETRYAAGDATETEREMARLGIDSGRRSFDYARSTLADVTQGAARYGFKGPAQFVPLKFVLPEVAPQDTLAYRIAALELERTKALALEQSVYSVVDEVRLGTRYNGEDYELSGGVGLEQGRPSVDVYARYVDRDPDVWTVTLGATFRLDDDTVERFNSAARDVEDDQGDLGELAEDLAEQLEDAREDAVFDGGTVDVGARDLELIDRRIRELEVQLGALPDQVATREAQLEDAQSRLDDLRGQREGEADATRQQALDSAVANLEAELTGFQTELDETRQEEADAQATLDQYREFRPMSEESLYLSWSGYLVSVDFYLGLAGADWQAVAK